MKRLPDSKKSISTIHALFSLTAMTWLLVGCSVTPQEQENSTPPPQTGNTEITKQCRALGRGINLGNALEAPEEGAWGVRIQNDYFTLIKDKRFDSVRIPIRWSAHADPKPPYIIQNTFFKRVDEVIDEALANGLRVVINIHHYEELMKEPAAHRDRFLALWKQIAEHYQNYPDSLYFELLNEPTGLLSAELWNAYLAAAIEVIRKTNPKRPIIVDTAEWGGLTSLNKLMLPDKDRNLIVSYHYYEPFHFTHQGAPWIGGSSPWVGTTWVGTAHQQEKIEEDFDDAAQWAETNDRPLYMGEFGAYKEADERSRALWTEFVARAAEKQEISWAYWEFCAGFGIYDPEKGVWRTTLLEALIPSEGENLGTNELE